MSFHEESSIVITPNAYKACTLYAVVPTSGAADMDVTRATAATRVDESGLVNYALGVEEVTNGDFSNGSTDWTPFGSTFVVSNANPYNGNDTALFTASGVNGAKVTQSITTVVGNTYHLSCYAQYNSGDQTQIEIEGVLEYPNGIAVTSGVTTFTFLQTSFTATSTTSVVAIRERGGNNNASCYLYDISVKEVNNVPRIDYTGGGCPHILAEPQRENLETTSASGTYGNDPASEILAIAPDGLNTAIRPVPDSGADRYQYTITGGSYSSGYEVTYSWYRKRFSTPVEDNFVGDLKINTLVNCTQVGVTIEIASNINGYDRFSATFSITDGSLNSILRLYFGTVIGDGNSSIAYWGHQLEAGSYATSYIPTSGSTVTRNQDVFTRDGISSLINSTEGVLFAEIAAFADYSTYRYMGLTDGSSDNRIIILYYNSSTRIRVLLSSGGTKYFDSSYAVTSIEDFHKVALKWKENDFALWVDGVKRALDTSGLVPIGLNTLALDQAGGDNFYGKVKQLQVYPTALSDAELTSLTTP